MVLNTVKKEAMNLNSGYTDQSSEKVEVTTWGTLQQTGGGYE
jgi:hypothetical protein